VPRARKGIRAGRPRKPAARKARPAAAGVAKPRGASSPARAPTGANVLRLAGVGTAAVLRATGRPWSEWLSVLDRAGAGAMAHKDIALLLSRKYGVPDWWSQMVTVGYEQARGLRAAGERKDGFAASASRTVQADLARLYDAWSDHALRARWLLDAPVEVRRSTDGKSMRLTWTAGDSRVDVGFQAKGPGKSQVAVEHARLKDARAATRQKAFWTAALGRLKALLEAGG
jgi:uncharacterized protein YndB with AHSA1/START domain